MLFPTFGFLFFFAAILPLNWILKRWPLLWRLFLLASSYYFYSVWELRFLFILVAVSLFNFISAFSIGRNFLRGRKIILALAVIADLSVLGFFKYYDFFRVSTETLLGKIGFQATLPLLEIFLPVGLSFYIFRAISYNIDVYSRKMAASGSLLDVSIYIAFFPQLLSGPIMRAGDFFDQLKNGGARYVENFNENLTLIFLGLFKKLVVSSYLVLNITDDVFAVPENHSPYVILLAVFAYSLVIYFDFSSYSDMAIGFAGLLGFRSPINFNVPYLASNIKDFWKRWHISLSSWVRDYIYIPLGGSRKGLFRKYFNLMAIMVIIGFWHGAAGNFIIWGAIQGAALVFYNIYKDARNRFLKPDYGERGGFGRAAGELFWWLMTFNFISFSWIFFRAPTAESALKFMKALFNFENGLEPVKAYILVLLAIGFALFVFEKQIIGLFTSLQYRVNFALLTFLSIFVLILILKLSPDILPPFIYFRF